MKSEPSWTAPSLGKQENSSNDSGLWLIAVIPHFLLLKLGMKGVAKRNGTHQSVKNW